MAAGLGTRMRSAVPKHLHPLLGRRMVDWVLAATQPLSPDPLVVVTSPDSRAALADVEGVRLVVQPEPAGTGDAVSTARSALDGGAADILVLSGDTPLLTADLLEQLAGTASLGRRRCHRALVRASGGRRLRARAPRRGRRAGCDRRGGGRVVHRASGDRGEQLDLHLRARRPLGCHRDAGAAQRAGRALPHRLRARRRRQRWNGRRAYRR